MSLGALKCIHPLFFVQPLPTHFHFLEPRNNELEERVDKAELLHVFLLPPLLDLGVDEHLKVIGLVEEAISQSTDGGQADHPVDEEHTVEVSHMVGGQVAQVEVGCSFLHFVDLTEELRVKAGAARGHVEGPAFGHVWSEDRGQLVEGLLDYFVDDFAGHGGW